MLVVEPLPSGKNLTAYVIYRPKDRKDLRKKTCGNDDDKSEVEDFLDKLRTYSGKQVI